MTPQERAEYEILKLANENGKIAIDVLHSFDDPEKQYAFERLQLRGWIRLIDVSFIATPVAAGRLMRIFLTSPDAQTWVRKGADDAEQ